MDKKKKVLTIAIVVGLIIVGVGVALMFLGGNQEYTVTFDSNGGSPVESVKVKKGDKVHPPIEPTYEGHTFVSWKKDGVTYDFNSAVTEDFTLKAAWDGAAAPVKSGFTVTFDTDGGSAVDSQIVAEGEYATKPTDPTKSGYLFSKWVVNGDEFAFDKPITGDMTITAVWDVDPNASSTGTKHTVKFDTGGGTKITDRTVEDGKKVNKPANPTRTGYTFVEWTFNGSTYDFNQPVTSDITLVAAWKEATKFTVTFDSDGGSEVTEQQVNEGSRATKPKDPTKNGYTFIEWQLNGKAYSFTNKVTANITLKAKWVSNSDVFTVKFDTDGGSQIADKKVIKNNTVAQPANPTKTGYTFVEWQLNGTKYNFSTKVTANITLKAVWKKNETTKYTVTFNSAGGSEVASQQVAAGGNATQPSNPTKSGYTFVEWQLNGSRFSFGTAINSNITLVAKWSENTPSVTNYTVTFNSNGGSSVASQTVQAGGHATEPGTPTRSGYTFVRWELNGSAYNFSSAVNGNITLTAVWQENAPVVTNYTVSFDSEGGSSVASQTVQAGGHATRPSNPTRSGYTFVAWQLNGSNYDFGSAVNSNITLVAKWQKNASYTVTATRVDDFSPSYTLKAYKDGSPISVTSYIINGSTINSSQVNQAIIRGVTSVQIVLTSGETVSATLTIN